MNKRISNSTACKTFRLAMLSSIMLCSASAMAQEEESVIDRYLDSLNVASSRVSQHTQSNINPYYFQVFFPDTYYSSVVGSLFSLNENSQTPVNERLMRYYTSRPQTIIRYNTDSATALKNDAQKQQANKEEKKPEVKKPEEKKDIQNKVAVDPITNPHGEADDLSIDLKVKRPNFWKTSGAFELQFTQNYFSENWYRGGNNNWTMMTKLRLQANYNDTKKVSWENKLEINLGFVTTTSDTCHSFLTNTDRIQLNTKIGIKASKAWYYTVSGEAKTQLLPGYKSNNKLKFSDFASPLDVTVSSGMDFKPTMKNGNTLSVAILPFSYKIRYIASQDANIRKTYRFVGRKITKDIGSRIDFNCNFKLVKNLSWRCRSYYFTSYKYAEAEMENVFSFSFSKYISSEVNTLWRFDDNRGKQFYDDNLGYFQFKEFITLGLKYNF